MKEGEIIELYGIKFKIIRSDCNQCALFGRCELEDIDICRREQIGRNKCFEKVNN